MVLLKIVAEVDIFLISDPKYVRLKQFSQITVSRPMWYYNAANCQHYVDFRWTTVSNRTTHQVAQNQLSMELKWKLIWWLIFYSNSSCLKESYQLVFQIKILISVPLSMIIFFGIMLKLSSKWIFKTNEIDSRRAFSIRISVGIKVSSQNGISFPKKIIFYSLHRKEKK